MGAWATSALVSPVAETPPLLLGGAVVLSDPDEVSSAGGVAVGVSGVVLVTGVVSIVVVVVVTGVMGAVPAGPGEGVVVGVVVAVVGSVVVAVVTSVTCVAACGSVGFGVVVAGGVVAAAVVGTALLTSLAFFAASPRGWVVALWAVLEPEVTGWAACRTTTGGWLTSAVVGATAARATRGW